MPTNTLTDAKCKAAKPKDKAFKLFNGGGMFLWVSPKGAKVWRIAYRLRGRQQQLSLGTYPTVSLADARTKREEVHSQLAAGEDPSAPRKASRAGRTLAQANEQYLATRGDLSAAYLKKSKRAIERYCYPRFEHRNVASLTRDDLLDVLRGIDAACKHVLVRKVSLWLNMVMDWAVEHGHAKINPAAMINSRKAFGRGKVVNMPALQLNEVPDLMRRLSLENPLQSVLGCRLLALTWLRTNELRMLRWDEVDGDLLRLPAGRMKRDRDHLVPLSKQAIAILEQLRLRCRGSELVFPTDRRIDRPMSKNAILYLLHRIGYKGRMSGHGWRTVGSTWANENGYNTDAIERQLAHAPEDKVRAAYNRAEYLPQRRKILQDWADWLESCEVDAGSAEGGKPPAARSAG